MRIKTVSPEEASVSWHVLGQGALTSRIRTEILRVLNEQHLQPGDRLPAERELAATLHVSRPSVREAVRSLQAEGYLVVKHGQGVFVAEPESREQLRASLAELKHSLDEMFAMREVLEVPAARWAAERRERSALDRIQDAYDRLEEALDEDVLDYQRLQRLDSEFHIRIVQAAGNRLLEETQNVLQELMRKGMEASLEIPGRPEQSRHEHSRILEAILAGDTAVAARAAKSHVRAAHKAVNRSRTIETGDVPAQLGSATAGGPWSAEGA